MKLADLSFEPLRTDHDLSGFECGEDEITNFLKEDSLNYQAQHMAKTYLFMEPDNIIAAYFCISNDCLVDRGEERGYTRKAFNRLHRSVGIPNDKRIFQYPAVKVGRLGVASVHQGTGLAYELLDFIKGYVITDTKAACRFLLLDALNKPKQLKYYSNNEFTFLLEDDQDHVNRIMYYDLARLY